jgi:hypothetical protein
MRRWHRYATFEEEYQMGAFGINRSPAKAAVLAAAVMLGGIGLAAPAQAADSYIALSYSLQSQKSGIAIADSESAARVASLRDCQANGGNQCVPYVNVKNACAAIAVFGTEEWTIGKGSELALAQKQALTNNPGSRLGASGCATSLQAPQPDQSAPQSTPPLPPPPPVENDYDNDGLSKQDELFTHYTNPFAADTDLDGIKDGDEVRNGTNPLNYFSP